MFQRSRVGPFAVALTVLGLVAALAFSNNRNDASGFNHNSPSKVALAPQEVTSTNPTVSVGNSQVFSGNCAAFGNNVPALANLGNSGFGNMNSRGVTVTGVGKVNRGRMVASVAALVCRNNLPAAGSPSNTAEHGNVAIANPGGTNNSFGNDTGVETGHGAAVIDASNSGVLGFVGSSVTVHRLNC